MLIDLETARFNIKFSEEDDENVYELIEAASRIVLQHLKIALDSYQDEDEQPLDVPPEVRQMVILATRSLYDDPTADPLTPAVRAIAIPLRDPAIA